MSRANGITSAAFQALAFEETLTAAQQAEVRGRQGFPAGEIHRWTKDFSVSKQILWLGDSITFGSSSSNVSAYSFRALVPIRLGSSYLATTGSRAAVNGGYPGESAELLLGRLPGLLTTSPDIVHILLGTNSSSSFSVYKASIISIVDLCRKSGATVIISLIPPRDAASMARVTQYNTFLALYCQANGIPLIDIHGPLVDQTTGALNATLFAVDEVHPNNLGHSTIATTIVDALKKLLTAPTLPPLWYVGNALLNNPLSGTGWSNLGGTATTVTTAAEDPVAGDGVTLGKWFTFTVDNSAGGGAVTNSRALTCTPAPSVGDVILFTYLTQDCKAEIVNNNTPFAVLVQGDQGKPGRMLDQITVPATPNGIRFRVTVTAAAGQIVKGKAGMVQAWNLTTGALLEFQ